MTDLYKIIAVNGHYEVYGSENEFLFSGDTYSECEEDLKEFFE